MLSPLGNGFSVTPKTPSFEKPKYKVYGFLPYWMLENAEYLQLDKLTDISYFSLGINADGTIKTRDADGNTEPGYSRWKNSEVLKKLIQDSKIYGVKFSLT